MEKEDCRFNTIHLFKQNINHEELMKMIYIMHNTVCFSTFPYLKYNEHNSSESIQHYNSGNCISFGYFMKMYLFNNYHVKSYIIGASVPSIFKVDGTPQMCHCALLIPLSLHEFYILDGALYFLEPMYCNLYELKERVINISNIYAYKKDRVVYSLLPCEERQLDIDYNQTLPEHCLCLKCYFEDMKSDVWSYYLCEIENPDNNIGHSFLLHKPEPFMLYTRFNGEDIQLKYKIQIINDEYVVTNYPESMEIYRGNGKDPKFMKIYRKLAQYFRDKL